jgi:hypothetical protein
VGGGILSTSVGQVKARYAGSDSIRIRRLSASTPLPEVGLLKTIKNEQGAIWDVQKPL